MQKPKRNSSGRYNKLMISTHTAVNQTTCALIITQQAVKRTAFAV